MPGCIVSATTASFRSVEKRRRRATPVITSTFENVSDIGVCLGLSLGPPAIAGVRSKRGAVHPHMKPTHLYERVEYPVLRPYSFKVPEQKYGRKSTIPQPGHLA
jgi:hypothetical protein